MPSFWPWRASSSSTASFEKTLSTLSVKITAAQAKLDRFRASSRRARVLSTLYLSFAYLVYAIVLLLVIGYKNLGALEWTGVAGGPVLIYATRALLAAYYNFRIESTSARLKEHQEERAKTIQKLKDATKYDSTMELIEKYGGGPKNKNKDAAEGEGADKSPKKKSQRGPVPGRTNMPPPATANVQRPPSTPQKPQDPMAPGADFAPNAESTDPPRAQPSPSSASPYPAQPMPPTTSLPEHHWYDRIFDVLLGEDETAPKNRIVLICRSCRLVNGQAPPGTRSLAELGPWRCMGCGAANGEAEDEGRRIVREVLATETEATDDDLVASEGAETEGELVGKPEDEEDDEEEQELDGPAASVRKRRSRAKE